MFSYYGSKSKIAHLYPAPQQDRIIEPFAGSARYSLLHWEREVWLYDVSDTVIGVWKYLLDASPKDILGLPDIPSKVNITDFAPSLTQAERDLIGFHLCRGKAKPRKTGHGQNNWNRDKIRIAENVYKIKHWKIIKASWENIDPLGLITATWFIDPPYQQIQQGNSDRYVHWKVDYGRLATFAQNRQGQVIVCEGDGADWLPFRLLTSVNTNTNNTTVKKNGEYIWEKINGKR